MPLSYDSTESSKGMVTSLNVAREWGSQDGYEAAMANKPSTSMPRLDQMSTEELVSAYKTYFKTRYDQTMAAKKKTGSSDPTKIALALSDTVQKDAADLEKLINVPSWEIADIVISNFNGAVASFQRKVLLEQVKLSANMVLSAKVASFLSQWRAAEAMMKARASYTPSSAVAEVRKARAAMNAIDKGVDDFIANVDKPVSPAPPKPPVVQPVVPMPPKTVDSLASKALLPGLALLLGLGGLGAGYYFFIYKPDKEREAAGLV